MIGFKWIEALGVVTLFVAVSASSPRQEVKPAQDPAQVCLPGITDKDTFPNGCVSCHIKAPDGDHRLNVVLKNVKDHPDVSALVKVVPKDCGMCHKAGPSPASFKTALHKVHYQKKEESLFVKQFQGACLSCHAIDLKTGKMTVKSGDKNW